MMSILHKFLLLALLTFALGSATSQTRLTANQVNVAIEASVSLSADTGLYSYSYAVTNYAGAPLSVSQINIPLNGASIINVSSPKGWESNINSNRTMMSWCACAEDGFVVPAGYVDDGRGLPSKYEINPGQTLAGFSLQSAFPPGSGIFYAKGSLPIPIEGIDFPEGQEPFTPDFPLNLFKGPLSQVPSYSPILEFGGRRPSVDGFLVFTSLTDGGVFKAPLAIDIVFSRQGEIVQEETFRATLNGIDITPQFRSLAPKQLRAVVSVGAALKVGKNVLQTVVHGTVPGASRQARDTDRLTFLIQ